MVISRVSSNCKRVLRMYPVMTNANLVVFAHLFPSFRLNALCLLSNVHHALLNAHSVYISDVFMCVNVCLRASDRHRSWRMINMTVIPKRHYAINHVVNLK